jgi:D-threo-aldose 1-dehydrogenase
MLATATRTVGRTGIEVTQLGFGGGALKDVRQPDADGAAALDTAWAGGVRYYDTAPFYGRGLSEHRLGGFLRGRHGQDFVLSSKVGRVLSPVPSARRPAGRTPVGDLDTWGIRYDYSRDGILRSIEDSIQRLGISAIDIAFVHDLDLVHLGPRARMRAHTDDLLRTGWPALCELKAEGVIRAIGFGINAIGLVGRWLDLFDPDVFLVAGPYTLMEQGGLVELDRCRERGIGVIIGQVFGSGILATGPTPGATYYYAEPGREELERAARLQRVCQSFEVPLASAALQFPLGHPSVAAVIPGVRDRQEARACLDAFAHPVPAELWSALVDQGLLAFSAPTPR